MTVVRESGQQSSLSCHRHRHFQSVGKIFEVLSQVDNVAGEQERDMYVVGRHEKSNSLAQLNKKNVKGNSF